MALFAAVLAVGLAVTGCGAASAGSGSGKGGFSVALMTSGPLGDKGFYDSANEGVLRAGKKYGIQTKVIQSPRSDPQQWVSDLDTLSDGTYDLVIFSASSNLENLREVVRNHPEQKYISFDQTIDEPNVLSILYKQNEGSFLAGVLAALVSAEKTGLPLSAGQRKAGFLGGVDLPIINDFRVGFEQGAKAADPSIKTVKTFAGNFDDPNKGYNLAKAMYGDGVGVVFTAAGPTGLGALKASKDANKYAIGVDSNQNGLYPGHVIASMIKRVDNSLSTEIKNAMDGKAKYGDSVYYGISNNGVDLVIDTKTVPASVISRLDELKAKVASGEVKVNTALN